MRIYAVVLRSQHVGEKQLVAVPVYVERLVNGNVVLVLAVFSQIHQNLVFNAAGCICGELDVLFGTERGNGFDKSHRSYRHKILQPYTRVLEFFRDIHHKPQVMYYKSIARLVVVAFHKLERGLFLFLGERCGQRLRASQIMDVIFAERYP